MNWLRRLATAVSSSRPARPSDGEEASLERSPRPTGPACSTCGRTDLPMVGDWDPPICQECDAAINFDAIQEAEWFDK